MRDQRETNVFKKCGDKNMRNRYSNRIHTMIGMENRSKRVKIITVDVGLSYSFFRIAIFIVIFDSIIKIHKFHLQSALCSVLKYI